jgi:hypothetical protein
MHIRHYGFLANRSREEKLPRCRRLIAAYNNAQTTEASQPTPAVAAPAAVRLNEPWLESQHRCPACGRGPMVIVEFCEPEDAAAAAVLEAHGMTAVDTS